MGETDLISRQAVIDAIDSFILDEVTDVHGDTVREILERLPSAPPKKICVAEVKVEIDDLKDYIDKAINAERWIPCSEKYPEPDDRVLVITDSYDYYVWDCMSGREDNYFWENESGYYHNKDEVIAWMPLPSPYKGEQE